MKRMRLSWRPDDERRNRNEIAVTTTTTTTKRTFEFPLFPATDEVRFDFEVGGFENKTRSAATPWTWLGRWVSAGKVSFHVDVEILEKSVVGQQIHLLKFTRKVKSYLQSASSVPIVRVNSVVYDLNNYYSVINNSPIIQFTDNLRHILLVHDNDDDFSLFFLFFSVMLCVGVCMLN